jgi:guanosine-3',5'-bis(diphosphate) 3'-pyrophosphohydrolase
MSVIYDPVMQAQHLATVEHVLKKQQLYGVLPYTHHLQNVYLILNRFGYGDDQVLMVSAWLHDIMEDCDVKRKLLEEMFGEEVADVVWRVTNEPGESRKVRAALTYPKIRESDRATVLKLADRIANVENGGTLVKMYSKEHEDFRRNIYRPGVADDMWTYLDALISTSS